MNNMNKLPILFFLMLTLFLAPSRFVAQTINDCEEGTIKCSCDGSTTTIEPLDTIDDTDDCQDTCTYYSTNDEAITGFTLSCTVDGAQTTVGQGTLDDTSSALSEVNFEDPVLSVEIPGLEFTPAFDSGGNAIVSNYIGEYIQAVYNWLIPAASLLAVVMLMIAGGCWRAATRVKSVKPKTACVTPQWDLFYSWVPTPSLILLIRICSRLSPWK